MNAHNDTASLELPGEQIFFQSVLDASIRLSIAEAEERKAWRKGTSVETCATFAVFADAARRALNSEWRDFVLHGDISRAHNAYRRVAA